MKYAMLCCSAMLRKVSLRRCHTAFEFLRMWRGECSLRRATRLSSFFNVKKNVLGQDGLLATTEKFPLTQDSHVETIDWPQQVSAQTPDDARPRELQLTPVAWPTGSWWAQTADRLTGHFRLGPILSIYGSATLARQTRQSSG